MEVQSLFGRGRKGAVARTGTSGRDMRLAVGKVQFEREEKAAVCSWGIATEEY